MSGDVNAAAETIRYALNHAGATCDVPPEEDDNLAEIAEECQAALRSLYALVAEVESLRAQVAKGNAETTTALQRADSWKGEAEQLRAERDAAHHTSASLKVAAEAHLAEVNRLRVENQKLDEQAQRLQEALRKLDKWHGFPGEVARAALTATDPPRTMGWSADIHAADLATDPPEEP